MQQPHLPSPLHVLDPRSLEIQIQNPLVNLRSNGPVSWYVELNFQLFVAVRFLPLSPRATWGGHWGFTWIYRPSLRGRHALQGRKVSCWAGYILKQPGRIPWPKDLLLIVVQPQNSWKRSHKEAILSGPMKPPFSGEVTSHRYISPRIVLFWISSGESVSFRTAAKSLAAKGTGMLVVIYWPREAQMDH